MSGSWVAALDGGGTKTALALASRQGEVRIFPPGPGCNPQDGPGWDLVLEGVLGPVARAGLAAAVLGIPGRGEVPAYEATVDAVLTKLLPCPHEAMNDVALAHLGAFGGGEGVLLLAGTGSMAWARGPLGEARVGGWGDAFGDEGSAFWIGREGLARAASAIDGRDPGDRDFADALRACLRADDLGTFWPLAWLMAQGAAQRSAIAGVAPWIDALGRQGHDAAQQIMVGAAGYLAHLARIAAVRAGLGPFWPWAAAGGAFRSPILSGLVQQELGRPPITPRLTALGGGLLRAATLAGWAPDEAWAARVDARLRAFAAPTPPAAGSGATPHTVAGRRA